jgi:uncharacterized protein YcbK (DUF882 family)
MPFSTRPMRDEDWSRISRFSKHEFKNPERMGFEFMLWLDQVAIQCDVAVVISSSYRSKEYNQSVGGAANSAHTDNICDAVDIKMHKTRSDPNWNFARYQIFTLALKLGCKRIGMYPNGSLHLDMTHDRRPSPRIWVAVDNPA